MAEALQLLCTCGDQFVLGTGVRTNRVEDRKPWAVPKGIEKTLAAWFDEHQACSMTRYPTRPAIMVGVVE